MSRDGSKKQGDNKNREPKTRGSTLAAAFGKFKDTVDSKVDFGSAVLSTQKSSTVISSTTYSSRSSRIFSSTAMVEETREQKERAIAEFGKDVATYLVRELGFNPDEIGLHVYFSNDDRGNSCL